MKISKVNKFWLLNKMKVFGLSKFRVSWTPYKNAEWGQAFILYAFSKERALSKFQKKKQMKKGYVEIHSI